MIIKFFLLFLGITLFIVLLYQWEFTWKRYRNKKAYSILKKNYGKNGYLEFGDGKNFVLKLPDFEKRREISELISYFYDFIFPVLVSYNFVDKKVKKYFHEDDGPYIYSEVTIKPGDVVVDAGANMGIFSALSSAMGGIVYAFEPVAETIEKYLSKVAMLNPNINIVPFALSNIIGEIEIEIPISKKHLGLAGASIVRNFKKCKKEKIKTITLDRWVEENNIKKVDFIKADIEGAERLMLEGATNVLKNFSPKLSICTYHLPDDKKVLSELILKSNPNYIIEYRSSIRSGKSKLYAYVNKK